MAKKKKKSKAAKAVKAAKKNVIPLGVLEKRLHRLRAIVVSRGGKP